MGKYKEWISVYQFCGKDIQKTMRLASFMERLGIHGDQFKIEFLLDIERLMEKRDQNA